MDDIRKEFIKEILETLKIPIGAFNVGTVSEEITHIPDNQLRAFHKALFGTDHSYLNGMDRIIKVAEQFKPQATGHEEEKAKELIELVKGMNESVYQEHMKTGVRFDDLLKAAKFETVPDETKAILKRVRPCYDLKALIAKNNTGWGTVEQLNAYKHAIKHGANEIANDRLNKMIKG